MLSCLISRGRSVDALRATFGTAAFRFMIRPPATIVSEICSTAWHSMGDRTESDDPPVLCWHLAQMDWIDRPMRQQDQGKVRAGAVFKQLLPCLMTTRRRATSPAYGQEMKT